MLGKSIKSGLAILCALFVVSVFAGCRGDISRKPPVHLNPNMDTQDKFKAYRKSTFFADGRTMRHPPLGTVARGKLKADTKLHCGKANSNDCASKEDVAFIEEMPIELTMAVMERGRDRYNIYCAPCHAKDGFGKGKVALRSADANGQMAIKPPTFHSKRLGQMPVGQIYHTIAYGSKSGAMSGYRHQLTDVNDRWAIVAYIRALQRSQDAQVSFYVKPPPPPPPAPVVPEGEQPAEDGAQAPAGEPGQAPAKATDNQKATDAAGAAPSTEGTKPGGAPAPSGQEKK
ncbi:MAG: c-type cytochrome [Bradymonadia bacterium]